jgi:hypothetical protein
LSFKFCQGKTSSYWDHFSGIARFCNEGMASRITQAVLFPKLAKKIRSQLFHFDSFFSKKSIVGFLPKSVTRQSISESLYAASKTDSAVLISAYDELDGKCCTLSEASELVLGVAPGTIISVVPGNILYYEAEYPAERRLLVTVSA